MEHKPFAARVTKHSTFGDCALSQGGNMDQITVTYREGYEYGMGADRASGNPLGLGVSGEATQVEGATGGSGDFSMSRIQSTEDLETHLGISADASAGVGLFSASARFNFARDCKVQKSSIALI